MWINLAASGRQVFIFTKKLNPESEHIQSKVFLLMTNGLFRRLALVWVGAVLLLAVPTLLMAQEVESIPDCVLGVDREATPINLIEVRRKINYPKDAENRQIQGMVVIKVLVGEDGRIKRHIVKKTPDDLLTEEVVRILPIIRFEPAQYKGEPVSMWVVVPFDFSTSGGKAKRSKK